MRRVAQYQSYTPVIDTQRGLLLGTSIASSSSSSVLQAVAWCLALTLVSFLWAHAAYNRTVARLKGNGWRMYRRLLESSDGSMSPCTPRPVGPDDLVRCTPE